MKPLEDRIGMSTLCMEGISIEETIGKIRDAGFKAIEIVPVKVQRDSNIDYWLAYFNATKRREIALLLKDFETVTVHSSNLGVNICQTDAAERQRAADRYNALMEFAFDVGAQTVTMHAGNAGDQVLTDKYHSEYGRAAAEYRELSDG